MIHKRKVANRHQTLCEQLGSKIYLSSHITCPSCLLLMVNEPSSKTQEEVFISLDQAVENGYDLTDWSEAEIARDLHEYDSQFEDVDPTSLVEHIEAWKVQRTQL